MSSEAKSTVPKPFVFVLMPFDSAFSDVYELGIKQACKDVGAYCERVDEQVFEGTILQRVYNQIFKADIIVADMTGRNPNVFYEVGYAHALGKRVVLLTQNHDDIPFDLKDYTHIIYKGSITSLKQELFKRLQWFIQHPSEETLGLDYDNLEFYFNGNLIEQNSLHEVNLDYAVTSYDFISFGLAIHNLSNRAADLSHLEIGLITPRALGASVNHFQVAKLPNERSMYIFNSIGRILPNSWKPLTIQIDTSDKRADATAIQMLSELENTEVECSLLLFTEFGTRKTDFRLLIFNHRGLGIKLSQNGNYDLALNQFMKMPIRSSLDCSFIYNAACEYAQKKRKEDALNLLDKAMSFNSEYIKAAKDEDFKDLWSDTDFKKLIDKYRPEKAAEKDH